MNGQFAHVSHQQEPVSNVNIPWVIDMLKAVSIHQKPKEHVVISRGLVATASALVLGISTVMVPLANPSGTIPTASAQTTPVSYNGFAVQPSVDGKPVAVSTSPNVEGNQLAEPGAADEPVYRYQGVVYQMVREPIRADLGGIQDGVQIYRWVTKERSGNKSTACRLDATSLAVNDPGLVNPSINGFLESGRFDDEFVSPLQIQHWGSTYRIPIATGRDLTDVRIELHLPPGSAPVLPPASQSVRFTGVKPLPIKGSPGEFVNTSQYDTPATGRQDVSTQWVTESAVQAADGSWTVVSVLPSMPAGSTAVLQYSSTPTQAGAANGANIQVTAEHSCDFDLVYPDSTVTPGGTVKVDHADAEVPAGTTFGIDPAFDVPDGWTVSVDPKTGVVTATAPRGAAPGDTITVPVIATLPDGGGTVAGTAKITVTEADGSSIGGSSDQCIAAGLTVGLPLLLLIPIGLASQVNIPGLDGIVGPINQQITQLNTQIQQQGGFFNADAARFAEQFNAQVGGPAGRALGGVALVAAGLLAAGYLANSCAPGADGSSLGSTDGSADGSAAGSADSSSDLLGLSSES